MDKSEFDDYADTYSQLHSKSIEFSGEDTSFFAEYKIKEIFRILKDKSDKLNILDFGSGVGSSVPFWKKYFPNSRLSNSDVSAKSLEVARTKYQSQVNDIIQIGENLPVKDEAFDLTFTSCVFHHIPPEEHLKWLGELKRVTRKEGSVIIFEHNPWNPLTQKAVKDCPFDEDAILISAPKMKRQLKDAGFTKVNIRYTLFFPKALSFLRFIEPLLCFCPIGAQYYIIASK